MKDEVGGKNIPNFLGLRAKTYSYLIDDGTKMFVIKENINLQIIETAQKQLNLRIK